MKVILFNLAGVFVLFVMLEFASKVYGPRPFPGIAKDTSVQKRMSGEKLDRQSLINELGAHIYDQPPSPHLSRYDYEALKGFSYADIDQSKVPNRQWTYAPDGLSRSSRFIKKIKNSDLKVFDVTYRMTPMDKRFVEGQERKSKTDSFVLAAGDSFTFGEGVDQGQDYPSTLASMIGPNWTVYNYGVTGDSANDFFIRSNFDQNYFSPIKEQKGVFIWVYHDVQMQRLIYPTNAYKKASYIASKPEYTLEDGELIFHGFFNKSNRPFRSLINGLADLNMTSTFELEIPRVYTEKHFQLFFTLLNSTLLRMEESNHHFTKKILVAYNAHNEFEKLKAAAAQNGFEVLDIEKILYVRDRHFGGDLNLTIPVDGHPSPEAYWLLSTTLKDKYFR